MLKQIGYFLIGILLPGFGLALRRYNLSAFLYPVSIGLLISLSANTGYFLQPESAITVIVLLLLLIVVSSIHGLTRVRCGPGSRRGRLHGFILSGHVLLWLCLITGLLLFRQAWLGLEFYSIQGDSMAPTLEPDDIVVAEIISTTARLHENDVVVFTYPNSDKILIKRYVPIKEADFEDQSKVFVLGDNLDNSLDSRLLGAISRDRIIGKVHWILIKDSGLAFEKVL